MRKVLLFALLLTVAAPELAGAQTAVTGVVKDESGAVVSGAAILVKTGNRLEQRAVTNSDGRFTLERGAQGQLVVRAVGFAEEEVPITAGSEMQVVLALAPHLEAVTVTPTRTEQRLGDVPASVNIVDKETIRRSPAVIADDVLRLVPTFSLFRRTSSLSAHPTAQGVSLRGIGPSGVSRSLVLIDGVPFNDPFGGWVYWTRVPLDSIERIEVVDGASSSTYGNYAMGGVINFVSSRPRPMALDVRTQLGNRDSRKVDFLASDVWGRFGASLDGSFFRTDGFPQVLAAERGLVDTKAAVDYNNVALKLDYGLGDRTSVFVRGGYFREERDNAKVTTIPAGAAPRPEENDTTWKSFSAGTRVALPDQSDLQARLFLDWNEFDSNFMAVAPAPAPLLTPRAIGRMTLLQHVPTTGVGFTAQWAKALNTRAVVSAGTDFRHVDGVSEERALDVPTGTTVATLRDTGGTQTSSGAFAQGQFWVVPQLSVTVSGRVDHWRNFDAFHNEVSAATGLPTANNRGALPEKEDTVFSPRLGVLYHATDKVTAWGSIGSGFRAPTLNELYRQFSVGQLLTRANAELDPERLVGGELGVNVAPVSNLTVRGTFFDNRMRDPIANVTIGTNLQQRQNLGRTRVRGFQTDVEYRMGDWRAGAGYVVNRARVTENPNVPALVGNFLAQVPKNRGSVSVSYSNPRYVTASVNAIFVGDQFDNDGNTLVLPAYGTVELSLLRAVGRNLDLFFTTQNLFDKEYYVQRNPTTIGSPRLVTGGVRVRWSGQ